MPDTRKDWEHFTQTEITTLTSLLAKRGVKLDEKQPHISGERFLMSGRKVVLVAHDTITNAGLIIKSSTEPESIREIEAERQARQTLKKIPFAYHPLLAPEELWYQKENGRVTVASEFIEQSAPYLSLPLIEQFDLILNAFTMLSGVRATTSAHAKIIKNVFGVWSTHDYQTSAESFVRRINELMTNNPNLIADLTDALGELSTNHENIEQYCGFLTHDDFALHNFRFCAGTIYLIDQSSLRFGNKHESWARFMNYMLLYNRNLEQALLQYLKDNAAPEELLSLRLLRIYKIIELLHYHSKAASLADGDVQKLSARRVTFWHQVLKSLLSNESVKEADIIAYQLDRDQLRSTEEVARQRALQQLL